MLTSLTRVDISVFGWHSFHRGRRSYRSRVSYLIAKERSHEEQDILCGLDLGYWLKFGLVAQNITLFDERAHNL